MKRQTLLLPLLILSACSPKQAIDDYTPKVSGQLVKHQYYMLDYSEHHKQANWVFYLLTKDMLKGTAKRVNKYKPDPKVLTGSAKLSDYTNSIYTCGQLVPAGDMKVNPTAMSESFYLSNISPQNNDFNGGGWRELEEFVRDTAKRNEKLYIATGPIFKHSTSTIGTNKVTVPGQYYKIVYSPGTKEMMAFVMPNKKITKPLSDYLVPADKVESLTGIDFFPQLDDLTENKLEASRVWIGETTGDGMVNWVKMIKDIGPFVLGIAVLIFTWRQHVLAKAKFRHELFDRRYAIYESFQKFITYVVHDWHYEEGTGNVDTVKFHKEYAEFRIGIKDIDFFFSKYILEKMKKISKDSFSIKNLEIKLSNHLCDDEHRETTAEIHKLTQQLDEELKNLNKTFAPYLDFKKWK